MIKKPVDISIPIRPISLGSVVSYLLCSSPPIGLSVYACVFVCMCVGLGGHWHHMVGPWLWQTDTLVIDGSQPLRW